MVYQYNVTKTSRQSAEVDDVVLTATTTTRLIMRPTLVDNPNNTDAKVKISLIHQRKSSKGQWEDDSGEPLSTLKADQQIKLALDSATTLELRRQLENIYALHGSTRFSFQGSELVVGSEDEIIETDAGRAKVIKALLAHDHSEEIWNELVNSNPDLVTRLSYSRIHSERKQTLENFKKALNENRDESWWQNFFETNLWIFGYGLRYCFLNTVQSQPNYGGTTVSGRGGEKGDFLAQTEAEAKFTVLVEIKKPSSALFQGSTKHRNGAWLLGNELVGGISQLQANCRRWELEGSKIEANCEALLKKGVHTVSPKAILVIGVTSQFLADRDKRNSFELFRRNLHNPEIITFDELYERAKFIVGKNEEKRTNTAESIDTIDDVNDSDNDIPF